MAYRIMGLSPVAFAPLFTASDAELAARRARRVIADTDRGFPCRVSLEDARAGETLLLLHHTSHDVEMPFRASHAIYVRQNAPQADYTDALPPVFAGRVLSLRGFDTTGMLRDAVLAAGEEAEGGIHALFAQPHITYIHAHNATQGCFAARVDRYEGPAA